MFYLVLTALAVFTCQDLRCMYGLMQTAHNTTVAAPMPILNTHVQKMRVDCLEQRKRPQVPTCAITITDHALPSTVVTALHANDLTIVRNHFKYTLDVHQSRRQLSEALLLVAQRPPSKYQNLVSYLFFEIIPDHLDNIECIVNAAAHTGHTRIIEFIGKNAPAGVIIIPLLKAIEENNPYAVKILLAGIDANYRLAPITFSMFIRSAVMHGRPLCVRELVAAGAFVQEEDTEGLSSITHAFNLYMREKVGSEQDACRLAVIKELFKGVPEDEVDAELAKHLQKVPKELHRNITDAVNEGLYPEQLCMNENITQLKAKNQQLSQELKFKSACIDGFLSAITCGVIFGCALAHNRPMNE